MSKFHRSYHRYFGHQKTCTAWLQATACEDGIAPRLDKPWIIPSSDADWLHRIIHSLQLQTDQIRQDASRKLTQKGKQTQSAYVGDGRSTQTRFTGAEWWLESAPVQVGYAVNCPTRCMQTCCAGTSVCLDRELYYSHFCEGCQVFRRNEHTLINSSV